MVSTTKRKKFLLSKAEAALLIGLGARQFDSAIRPLLDDSEVTGNRAKLRFDGVAVVRAHLEYRLAQKESELGGDPLMTGGDSPALERYRDARASLAELELQRQQRTHISLADIESTLTQLTSHIRRAGETLQRRFGNEASDIFNDGIDEAERVLTSFAGGAKGVN